MDMNDKLHLRVEATSQKNGTTNSCELRELVDLEKSSVVADSHVTADLLEGSEGNVSKLLVVVQSKRVLDGGQVVGRN